MTETTHPALEALRKIIVLPGAGVYAEGYRDLARAAIPQLEALLAERDELRELLAGIVATAQGQREAHLHQMRFRIRKALAMSPPPAKARGEADG